MDKIKKASPFVILVLIFWIFWLPGPRVAGDYHLAEQGTILENSFPWIWRETNVSDGLGQYSGPTLWSQPLHSLAGLLSFLSVSGEYQTKILLLTILIIGYFSITKLLSLATTGIAKQIGAFFYLSNTFFMLMVDGGQLPLAASYAVLPLCVYQLIKAVREVSFKNTAYLALVLLLLSIFDIRVIVLFFVISMIYLFFEGLFIKSFVSFAVAVIFLALFHSFWLLPAMQTKAAFLPQTYERASQVDSLSFSSITHSLILQSPHWYNNVFGKINPPRVEFILISMLVFSSIILKRRSKFVLAWLTVSLVGIFLSKGTQDPLPQVYPWLFKYVPPFSLFRDPVKFYFLTALSYSVLLAVTVSSLNKKIIKVAAFLILVYLVFLLRPAFLGQMSGLLSLPAFQEEYLSLAESIKKDSNFSRIFWLPVKAPLGFTSSLHPAVESASFSQKRPAAASTKGTYETSNFLREASYMGQIFDVAGIGYIVYPYLDQKNLHPDNIKYFYTFADQLSRLPWLSKLDDSSVPAWRVNKHQDKFFITPDIWWVVGSDDIYNESTGSASLNLSRNGLIFAQEQPGLGKIINEIPEAKIVLNKKTSLDLAATFINQLDLIAPARLLDFAPDSSGWWKRETADLVSWRDFLQTKYGIDNQDFDLKLGWAVGEGNVKFKVQSSKFKEGNVLLARVMESSRSGKLKFYQETKIGEIGTKKEANNVRWFEVGTLLGNELIIESEGDINVVNALASLDKTLWENYQNKANELKHRITEFKKENTASSSATVSYKRINPTKYLVTVSNLLQPALLIFSQSYNTHWQLNGQSALPVYSLLNGFTVDRDGEYVVEFEPQKFILPGLAISALTLLITGIIIVCSKK